MELGGAFRGKVVLDLPFLDLVQVNSVARRDGKLVVQCEEGIGTVYFKDGKIISAETSNNLKAESAFYQMALWSNGEFLFASSSVDDVEKNITTDVSMLLLEAARRRDEANRAGLTRSGFLRLFPNSTSHHAPLSPLQQAYEQFLTERKRFEANANKDSSKSIESTPQNKKSNLIFGILVVFLMILIGVSVALFFWQKQKGF